MLVDSSCIEKVVQPVADMVAVDLVYIMSPHSDLISFSSMLVKTTAKIFQFLPAELNKSKP